MLHFQYLKQKAGGKLHSLAIQSPLLKIPVLAKFFNIWENWNDVVNNLSLTSYEYQKIFYTKLGLCTVLVGDVKQLIKK